jgi:hypothetical protein
MISPGISMVQPTTFFRIKNAPLKFNAYVNTRGISIADYSYFTGSK